MRGLGLCARLIATLTIVTLILSVGLPPGLMPQGDGWNSISWLWQWASSAPSWAKDPDLPQQTEGKGVDGHYVDTPVTPDNSKPVAKGRGELDRYQPRRLPAGVRSTGTGTKGFDARTSTRIASMATEKSNTYRNTDGSYSRQVHLLPVNYRAADGSWRPIDTTLVRGADRRPTVPANAAAVSFAAGTPRRLVDGELLPIDGRAVPAEDLVRLVGQPGIEVAYGLRDATLDTAAIEGSIARYRNAFPGVDLALSVRGIEVNETLRLHSPQASTEYVHPLRLTGATPRQDGSGGVEFVDRRGAVVLRLPAAVLTDASGATSQRVRYELVEVDGASAAKLILDGDWLRDAKRRFPVAVGTPDTPLALAFEPVPPGIEGLHLASARLQLQPIRCASKTFSVRMQGTAVGQAACPTAANAGNGTTVPLDAATIAAHATAGTTIQLETDFGVVNAFLDVAFIANVPPVIDPGNRYPANNTALSTLTPEFAARGRDPDNWPNTGLRYNFILYNDQGAQISSSGWTNGSWKVPAGVLSWGKVYLYAVQVDDFNMTGPAQPELYGLTTQIPQPPVTSSLAQNGGKGFEPSAGNYTTNDVDAQVAAVGPALAINRDYNSLDTRSTSAFGRGWSSIVDLHLREVVDADNVLRTAIVRYPNGQEVGFGRNNDGSWSPPMGRYSVFKPIAGGYSLTDKDTTTYEFARSAGGGVYQITKITDANARSLTFRYDTNGRIDQIRSVNSNRAISLQWTVPVGSTFAHVSQVSTDPVDPAVSTSVLTWTYTYSADKLTKVCPPGTTTACTVYDYRNISPYAMTVLNNGPYSFWRLNEASGEVAKSAALSNDGIDDATYANITYGVAGPVTDSTSTAAGFNGTSSSVKLPVKPATTSAYQSVSMWFKTATPVGVLLSFQTSVVTPGATTPNPYVPALYIDNTGRLRGQFWMGNPAAALVSANPVTDNAWHHVVLAGNGTSQQLYLDGNLVGNLAGNIVLHAANVPNAYIGAGFIGGPWPAQPNTTPTATFFNGTIAEVGYFNRSLTAAAVTALYGARTSTSAMSKITSNAGRQRAAIAYDTVTGRVNQVTDEHGGIWKLTVPTNVGSSQAYVSAVLGSQPREYFRFNDPTAPPKPAGVVSGYTATYHNVTFNTTPGARTSPFDDVIGGVFNGTSSYVQMDDPSALPHYGDFHIERHPSIEMWFKTPANHASSGVLYSYQMAAVDGPAPATPDWVPALYVGADGFLYGGFWTGSGGPMRSTTRVNDGNWHHVVLSETSRDEQSLYIDNALVATKTGDVTLITAERAYIGAGTTHLWPSASGPVSYFNGNIAEFAFYGHGLTAQQVDSHYKAYRSALAPPGNVTGPYLTPVTQVTVTDPTNKVTKKQYDVINGNRLIASTDTLGNTTSYGYDVGGFVSVVYDPLGHKTETGKDARGNTVRTTTCRNQVTAETTGCQTTYYRYWPDPAPPVLTPDPRNDQLVYIDSPRASEFGYNPWTAFTYDTAGNRLTMQTDGPNGSSGAYATTTMTYTTSTTPAVGGGTTPPGLPLTVTSPGGKIQRTDYNAAGDAARITDAAGLVTEFKYDGIGRAIEKKLISTAFPAGQITTFKYVNDGPPTESVNPPVTDRVTGVVHTGKTVDVFDPDGNLTSRIVSDLTGGDTARTVTNDYNTRGQVIKTTDPFGAVSIFSYDTYGNQNRVVECNSSPAPGTACPTADVLRTTMHTFDAEAHLLTTTVTGKDGVSTRVALNAYYKDGRLASETDAMNWTTRYEYYNDGKLRQVSRTDGTKTFVSAMYEYFEDGSLAQRRENNGATITTFRNNDAGYLISEASFVDGNMRTTEYGYDAEGRVAEIHDSNTWGQTRLRDEYRSYDPMGRLTGKRIAVKTASSPVGFWTMNEPWDSFTARDSSWSANDLSADELISFDGNHATFPSGNFSSYMSGRPAVDTTGSFTVSAWVWLASNTDGFQTFVSQDGAVNSGFFLQYDANVNKWGFSRPLTDTANPTVARAHSTAAAPLFAWTHLVGVFNAATNSISLYVNGALNGTAADPTSYQTTNGLLVGAGKWNGSLVDHVSGGSVDNVQMYPRALAASEVTALYGGGSGREANNAAGTNELATAYTVDNRGLTTAMVDPNNNTTNYEYDEAGRLARTIAPTVSTEVFGGSPISARPTITQGYNTFGDVVERQDPLGRVTTIRVDALGRPQQQILPDYTPPGGTAIVGATYLTEYDKLGQIKSTTDPRSMATLYEYDSLGNVSKVTGPTGKFTTAKYNKVGDRTEVVDPTGAKTTATYDYLGRTLTTSVVVRQPTTVTNTTTYDYGTGVFGATPEAGPWLQKVTSPAGVITRMTYNAAGEQRTVTDGVNNVTTTEYDGLGRPITLIKADGSKQTMSYDGGSRVLQTRHLDPAGTLMSSTTAAYDNTGNLTSIKDGRNTTRTFTYDALGSLKTEVQPVTTTTNLNTSFGYDAAGNRTRFTDGRNNAFWTTYNTWGLPESQIEPATTAYPNAADRTFTAAYDRAGRMASVTSPGGVSVVNTYNDLDQLTGQTGAGAEVATTARTFDYDDAGRLKTMSVPGGTNTMTYDDRGLLLTVTGPADSNTFTYNRDGRVATRADAAGTTTYTYDTAGRPRTVANPTTSINLLIEYNNVSLPWKVTHGTNGNQRTLTYDGMQRLKTDTLKTNNGATTLGSITYDYDANSNETLKVTTGVAGASSNTYGYDLANRLTSWTSGSTTTTYAYDASGNRTQAGSKTFTYDQRNQLLTQSGGTTYSYTPRGTLKQTSGPGGVYQTQADAFGQIINQQAAGGTASYAYDALGRSVKTGFKYTGLGNTLAQDPNATYTRGSAGDLVGVGTGTGAGSRYAWVDQHTDVVAQFAATATSLAGSATYDPLGKVTNTSGMVGNLGYQSEWTETLTGRINMHARWYNVDTGQFDTRDTFTNPAAPESIRANRFQYGDGNPLTTVDPTGHFGWKSITSGFKAATNVVSNAYSYVASGQAWNDVKAGASWIADKATQAWNVVADTTTRWAKDKFNKLKDGYNDAKKCIAGGVSKCVKDTAKNVVKKTVESVKNTVEAIKQDPWKFLVTAAVSIAAAAAVAAVCATGIGCLILAGAAAGAMSAGAGYMVDVTRGDRQFSWSGLASTMIEGGLDGALSAGMNRLGGGMLRVTGSAARAGGSALAAGTAKLFSGGKGSAGDGRSTAPAPVRPSGGTPGRPTAPSGGQAYRPRHESTEQSYEGRHRAAEEEYQGQHRTCGHSFDPATPVLLADGTTKPIAEVVVGDEVAATDPESGETTAEPVTALHVNVDRELSNVTVRDGTGTESVLETTQNHPFWDATIGDWVDAADLTPGHRLRVHDDAGAGVRGGGSGDPGVEVVVVEVDSFIGHQTMRDLTVDGVHTYYVVPGKTPVLVHNCGKGSAGGVDYVDTSSCTNVCLGVGKHSDDLAAAIGGHSFNGLRWGGTNTASGRPLWMEGVGAVAREGNIKISFSLDGLFGADGRTIANSPEDAFSANYARGLPLVGDWRLGAAPGNGTAWELATVGRAVRLGDREWSSIDWYWQGKKVNVNNPFG